MDPPDSIDLGSTTTEGDPDQLNQLRDLFRSADLNGYARWPPIMCTCCSLCAHLLAAYMHAFAGTV